MFFIRFSNVWPISLSDYPEFKRHNPRCNYHPSEMSIITLQIFSFIYFSKTWKKKHLKNLKMKN